MLAKIFKGIVVEFKSTEDILHFDKKHVWHPYSSTNSELPVYSVASAEGVHLTLHSGEQLIDGMSSWWSTIHGYNHSELNKALHDQIASMSHVMFGGLTHEPAVTLAKTLVEMTPEGLEKVFLCDSGSVAVEIALKMAIQYWNSLGENRHTFLTIKNGYHGDTFGAMSVCDPVTGMHQLFSGFLNKNLFAEAPECGFGDEWDDVFFDDFAEIARKQHESIAAVILEPIVQGAGGMRFYSPIFLQKVRALCDRYNILLIADEIATGFGRTGKLFACEYANISPDILCLGKALTGGYLSLAATLCTAHLAKVVCQGEAGVFMHGPTFMGNPLACAVANKSIELLESNNWHRQVASISKWLTTGLDSCKELSIVNDVRILGAIGVVELHSPVKMNIIQAMFVKHGIWLRPFGKLVYMMPPYISDEQIIQVLCKSVKNVLIEYKNYL